jgi:octopine/nopaline transport system permease protein
LKEPYWCAIIAFALNTGAYTSEILRSAFQTIKPGIIEAGKSLGISSKIIFYLPYISPIYFFICVVS